MADSGSASDPDLVPEILVGILDDSLDFWCRLCGFEVLYERREEGFAYITRGSAHIMIEQAGIGRNWTPAELERPLGRGVNFQISVESIDPLVRSLRDDGWALFMEPETKWYRTGENRGRCDSVPRSGSRRVPDQVPVIARQKTRERLVAHGLRATYCYETPASLENPSEQPKSIESKASSDALEQRSIRIDAHRRRVP